MHKHTYIIVALFTHIFQAPMLHLQKYTKTIYLNYHQFSRSPFLSFSDFFFFFVGKSEEVFNLIILKCIQFCIYGG